MKNGIILCIGIILLCLFTSVLSQQLLIRTTQKDNNLYSYTEIIGIYLNPFYKKFSQVMILLYSIGSNIAA